MTEKDASAEGCQEWDDDKLAELERAIESGEAGCHSDSVSSLFEEHRGAFLKIDQLAAPLRSAFAEVDTPPVLTDYEKLTEIGRGGMGVVYRAKHKRTQRQDAIKVIRRDRLSGMSGETMKRIQWRFQQESKLAARVAHEHIVPIYHVGEIADQPWFSMQLVDGANLRDLALDGGIATERAVRYIEAIARAVDVVHRHGIIHGDIKPHNILVERETDRPLISDFGLADFDARYSDDESPGVVGTLAYIAPELARAALEGQTPEEVAAVRSVATDVYSIGATLWSALSGCSPWDRQRTAVQHLEDVASGNLDFATDADGKIPPPLLRIILKCLSADPSARYSTAAEVANALAAWQDRPHWNRHFPKLRSLLWMVIAPVLLLSGIGVWWLLQMDAHEGWIWLVIFAGYGPLFAAFLVHRSAGGTAQRAHRELWSIWIGHLVSAFACMLALRILCHPDLNKTLAFFYPCWAAISSLVFFAKSGNFWSAYRWIGVVWAFVTVLLAITPYPPIVFGLFAAATCVVIAKGDRAFVS